MGSENKKQSELEFLVDFSKDKLERLAPWRQIFNRILFVVLLIAVTIESYYSSISGWYFIADLWFYILISVFVIPITGWADKKFRTYLRVYTDLIEVKEPGESAVEWELGQISAIEFQNNSLTIILSNGDVRKFNFGPTFLSYEEIQKTKKKINGINESLPRTIFNDEKVIEVI